MGSFWVEIMIDYQLQMYDSARILSHLCRFLFSQMFQNNV
jgi:hypothetical protein